MTRSIWGVRISRKEHEGRGGGGGGACHQAGPVHAGRVHPFCSGFLDEEELVGFFLHKERKQLRLLRHSEDTKTYDGHGMRLWSAKLLVLLQLLAFERVGDSA